MRLEGFRKLLQEIEKLAAVCGEEVVYWWKKTDAALQHVLFFLIAWPLIMIWAKLALPEDAASLAVPFIAFGPLLAGIYLMLVTIGPLLTVVGLSVGAILSPLRKLFLAIGLIIFFELLFGMYVWFIPIENAPTLILLLVALFFMWVLAEFLGSGVSKWRPIFAACFIIVTVLFFFGGIEGLRAKATEIDWEAKPAADTSVQPKSLGPPFLREDAPEREAQGVGDHREEVVDYFNVDPTPVSPINGLPEWSEWIYAPDSWRDWGKEFVGSDVEHCQAWFTFFNSGKLHGPYDANHLPEFTNPPPIDPNYPKTKWRVATNCTLRYFRRE